MSSTITLNASITRNYGPISVTFGLSRDIIIEKGSDVMEGYNTLCDIIEAQISEYEANRLPKLPAAPSRGIAADTKPAMAWHTAGKLRMSITSDGKKAYHIIPVGVPKWSKYGVPVYFDSCPDVTQDLVNQMLGNDTSCDIDSNMRMLVDERSGKPKVVGFKHKDQIGEA